MNRYLRYPRDYFRGIAYSFSLGVANGQRAGNDAETPQVTWKDATRQARGVERLGGRESREGRG